MPRKRGRPRIDPAARRDHQLNIRLAEAYWSRLLDLIAGAAADAEQKGKPFAPRQLVPTAVVRGWVMQLIDGGSPLTPSPRPTASTSAPRPTRWQRLEAAGAGPLLADRAALQGVANLLNQTTRGLNTVAAAGDTAQRLPPGPERDALRRRVPPVFFEYELTELVREVRRVCDLVAAKVAHADEMLERFER